MDENFSRIQRLPPYVFSIVDKLKAEARERGEALIDFGMGNPDRATPKHIVEAMVTAAMQKNMHRYSVSQGTLELRRAICNWYHRRYAVELDPATEAVVTMGSKEGLAHLAMALVDKGDTVLVPNPAYPIHPYGFIIAGADVIHVPIGPEVDFWEELERAIRNTLPKPKCLLLNFPNNPTTQCVSPAFFRQLIATAREHEVWVIQDLAYADIVFDGYRAPSILQVPGAKEIAVEFFSLSKSYNMPGWRVGFMVGNRTLVNALKRIKSYLDYGIYAPIQAASVVALEAEQQCVGEVCTLYQQRRDVLCDGLNAVGWPVEKPRATMFVWAPIPAQFQALGSLEFAKKLLNEAKIAVSPGIGFGDYGDRHVRFALVEDEQRTQQAVANVAKLLQLDAAAVKAG